MDCRQKALRNIVKQLKERYEGLECNGKMCRYTDHIHVIALYKYKSIKVNRHTMYNKSIMNLFNSQSIALISYLRGYYLKKWSKMNKSRKSGAWTDETRHQFMDTF